MINVHGTTSIFHWSTDSHIYQRRKNCIKLAAPLLYSYCYNVVRVLPYLIPIGVIMVHSSTYARPCVHPMTCASQMGGSMRALCYKNVLQRDNTIKMYIYKSLSKFNKTLRLNRYEKPLSSFFVCKENFVINQEQNLFSRNHLVYFHATPRATLTLLSCSPNFPRDSITRYTHAKHEPILNCSPRGVINFEALTRRLELGKGGGGTRLRDLFQRTSFEQIQLYKQYKK